MTKKLGVTLLALCCALGLCAVTALAANGNNAPATPTVEPQAPVSLAHFRQSGADVQQSIDNGKSWEIYSPVEEPDYFTYNEFSEWLETEMAHIQELVEAGEWTETEASETIANYRAILEGIANGQW